MASNQTQTPGTPGEMQGQMQASGPSPGASQPSQSAGSQNQMGSTSRSSSPQPTQDAGPQGGQYGQVRAERGDQERQGGSLQRQDGQQGGELQSSGRGLRGYARDPLTMLQQMSEEMDNLFSAFFNVPYWNRARNAVRAGRAELQQLWSPDIEMSEEGNRLRVCVDLPGIARENVNVDVKDGVLTIQGERREERNESDEKAGFRRSERRYGSFYRAVALPEGVDTEGAEATMKDGVLEISFPIAEQKQARRLQIR